MSIKIEDLTTGEVKGRGLFDELMRTTKDHLQEEFKAGRITGATYGEVYLGVLQSNLQNASQFVLQYQINSQQAELLQEQVLKAQKELELLTAQIAKTEADTNISVKQLDILAAQEGQITAQTNLIEEQLLTEQAKGDLTRQQIAQSVAQTDLVGKQEDLLDMQILTEKANTTDATGGLLKAKHDGQLAQNALIGQKKLTEESQTSDPAGYIDDDPKAERGGGLVGAQIALYKLQKEGFKRDAEQKMSKIYTDTWTVSQNLIGSPQSNAYGLNSANVNDALNELRKGMGLPVGVTPAPEG